jgi:CheY-like chemotaxis protein/two-component sensor histidine kinase
VKHMSSLLDDLLDVSRITRGSFVLKRSRIDVKSLLEAAVESVQPAIDVKRHTLRVEVPEVPVTLEVDPVRLTQVLTNLLTNAVKYTPANGLILLGARLESQEVTLFVRDNGVGLAPAMLTNVFNMFTQVEATGEAAEGGLGIGLALAKGLVELHGGRITAHSAGLGSGSEFVVTLPGSLIVQARQTAPGSGNGHAKSISSRRVLIADDNRDAAETLGMFLNLSGHEVHLVHTGAEALELTKKLKPDVAILDIGMPDLSGYEVASRIRREPWGAQITLVALTGWGQDEDRRRAQAAGFDHHCTKPVDPADLEDFFAPNGEP